MEHEAASRRLAHALLHGDLEGKWDAIGRLVRDIETLRTLGVPGIYAFAGGSDQRQSDAIWLRSWLSMLPPCLRHR